MLRRRFCAPVLPILLALTVSLVAPAAPHAQSGVSIGKSGLPVPRFVTLKSKKVNVRVGPGQDYKVSWIFTRPGLPIEIVQEFDNWRRVRDAEGEMGWVFHSLLSGVRSGVVAPWGQDEPEPVRRRPDRNARASALLQPGVVARVDTCKNGWCRVSGDNYRGWIDQQSLWGVYPDEEFD